MDQSRALNVGVAEANMMLIGEAFAALGYNAWVSTFCPFFDWKVMRRIAVGHQERLEAIEARDGWLSEGHGLDLTFLATAANFETRTNGATHMGNDDITIFDAIGHLKIIDVSCPRQLLAIMRWIMDGQSRLDLSAGHARRRRRHRTMPIFVSSSARATYCARARRGRCGRDREQRTRGA